MDKSMVLLLNATGFCRMVFAQVMKCAEFLLGRLQNAVKRPSSFCGGSARAAVVLVV